MAVKDSTDEEAKAIIDNEYHTNFYQIYRKQFDLFGTGVFAQTGMTWSTLLPGTASLFPALDPFFHEFSGWREK
jgi:hypothetical protein